MKKLVKQLLEYMWDDEMDSWMECDFDNRHVFVTMLKLNFLMGNPMKLEGCSHDSSGTSTSFRIKSVADFKKILKAEN